MEQALITQLQIIKLSDMKPNFSKLAKFYGVDRRTIKKYYDGYEGKPSHHNKHSKLDKHRDVIVNKLKIRGINIRAVYEFLISEVDPDIGTYSNFCKYINNNDLFQKTFCKGHPRFETAPGVQAQVDWKEDITLVNKYGESFTFQIFSYKLGYSRYPVFIYKLFKTRQDVFDCLIEAFKLTGGVPKEILFDNMASVVDLKGNQRTVNCRIKAFADDFNFKIKLCKPHHPFTKGKIEAANKFMSWLLPYEGEFETEEDIKSILRVINQKVCTQIHAETRISPVLLLQSEKECLHELPPRTIVESYQSHDRQTTVRKDSTVTFNKNKYSLPCEYIGKPVSLRVNGDVLEIYQSNELITSHKISVKRLNYHREHYTQLLSKSIKDSDILSDFADNNLRQLDNLL